MKTDFNLSIEKPCSANWNEMTPTAQGRFCGHCCHTVVDFTNMRDEEIKEYFRCHASQKTCGRFRSNQLSSPKRHRFSVKQLLLSCFAIIAFMIGCRKPPAHRPEKMGKVYINPSTQNIK